MEHSTFKIIPNETWNGKTWTRDTSVPKVKGSLSTVVTVSGDVWVAAALGKNGAGIPAMLHRTTGHWYVVPVPGSVYVASFAVSSRDSIWAEGGNTPALLHWNGSMWKTMAVPSWASQKFITSLAPGPGGSVWAIGEDFAYDWFSMHWNGKFWNHIAMPTLARGMEPLAIATIPGGTAWAVGGVPDCPTVNGCAASPPLVLRWSGKAWTRAKNLVLPETVTSELAWLDAVTVVSPTDAWAVGQACTGEFCKDGTTLILVGRALAAEDFPTVAQATDFKAGFSLSQKSLKALLALAQF